MAGYLPQFCFAKFFQVFLTNFFQVLAHFCQVFTTFNQVFTNFNQANNKICDFLKLFMKDLQLLK